MAENSNTIAGRYSVKFGNYEVFMSEYSSKLNPIESTEQPSSTGEIFFAESAGASTATGTLIVTDKTDIAFLNAYRGKISCYDFFLGKLEYIENARITGGIEKDHKTGLASISIIGGYGREVK